MKKIVLLLIIVFVVFVAVCRQRLFLRDPLAKVERSGAPVSQTAVLINYSNDILLDDQSSGHTRIYLVQNWNLTPSVPGELKCLAWFACLADADHVTAAPIHIRGKLATMTSKRIDFEDETNANVTVTLH